MAGHSVISDVYIGTSGWSYKHWSGIFYPENLNPTKYLEYYITRFGCVELNSSFYHLPKESTIRGWLNRTPAPFKFCPKLSRYITHQLRLLNSNDALLKFFNLFNELKPKMGPVLIQLPPGLPFEEKLVCDFINSLHNFGTDYQFAIEPRHNSWINEDCYDLLTAHGIAFVIADSGKRFPSSEIATTDFVYMRLHGPKSLYSSDYSEEGLNYYADKIISWLNEKKKVWVFFNNDFGGFAVHNAEQLRTIITYKLEP